MTNSKMDCKSILAKNPIEERGGVLYFIQPPSDIAPSRDANPTDRRTWSFWRRQNYSFLEEELTAFPSRSVLLDIGAGQSDFADVTKRFDVCGVDFYPYAGIRVVCDLEDRLPFKDEVADIVLMANLLEHVREPNALLTECYRILKPGGALLGTVPFMIQIHQRPYDFYRYTQMNLEYLLRKHSFRDPRVRAVSNLYVLLGNVSASFFMRTIREARFKLPWRILWKVMRMGFAVCRGMFEERTFDSDNPLGYLFKAYK